MRILLTEDDPILAPILKNALADQYHVVDIASDGHMAWEYADTLTYDLILLDIDLPKLDGLSLCRRLRQEGFQGPIILLTAKNLSTDKVKGLDAGADDYVVKPCTIDELNARIRAVMRRRQPYVQSLLSWGNLCLNPKTCEVTYQGEELSLSAKEYSLLELFLRNPQRIFSSSSILDYLWSFPDTPGEDTVRAHIKRLRRKLKTAGADGVIETVYGMGYRLNALPADEPEESSQANREAEPERGKDEVEALKQDTQNAIAQMWESFKGPILERIESLEEAIKALEQNHLSEDLRQEGSSIAHKLVGSLGMFGYGEGSEICRAMEQILRSEEYGDRAGELRSHFTQLQALLFPESPSPTPVPQEKKKEKPDSQLVLPISGDIPEISPSLLPDFSILAVDDDPLILQRLQQCLPPWGIAVTSVNNPHQFWPMLRQVKPQLLILDIEMPEITGLELCEAVRNDPDWNDLPILFFTSSNQPDTIHRLYHLGADDYVPKLASDPELVTRVLNRLERYQLLQSRSRIHSCSDPVDELTGFTRRYPALNQLQRLLDRCRQNSQVLTLVLIDIDRFKEINQQGGYVLGDRVLQSIAKILHFSCSRETLRVRWGDDEFLLAIPVLELAEIQDQLKKAIAQVERLEFAKITLRMGLVRFPDQGEELELLCDRAQKALEL